jgi:hypothetical protein
VIAERSTCAGINQSTAERNMARFVCLENDGSGPMDGRGTTQTHLHQPQQGKEFRRSQLRPRDRRWWASEQDRHSVIHFEIGAFEFANEDPAVRKSSLKIGDSKDGFVRQKSGTWISGFWRNGNDR